MQNQADKELKQLAIDLHHGKIFCDRHIKEPQDVSMVFMAVCLMDARQIKKLKADPPGMIYEYLDKAGPRSINGMPCFFSMQLLSQPDTEKVMRLVKKLRETENAVRAQPLP